MCTVTYIPPLARSSFILTSNRDEKVIRPATPPAVYSWDDKKLAYPKDEKAGGTWISANDKGKVCCLLNGAFVPHEKQGFHTVSRGTVLLEFTASDLKVHEYFAANELENVEPFTIVAIEQNNDIVYNLTEFVWDGNNKHFKQLDKDRPYIWSSVTLYNEEHRKLREDWFNKFLAENNNKLSPEKILAFHSGNHTIDNTINIVMQREEGIETVSITQVTSESGRVKLFYSDVLNKSIHRLEL
jgi:uncharacterized protein with NRDE domain